MCGHDFFVRINIMFCLFSSSIFWTFHYRQKLMVHALLVTNKEFSITLCIKMILHAIYGLAVY